MVNEKIVIDTINRMLEAGIDDDTIISTLKDIGLDQDSAKNLIAKTKSGNSSDDDSKNNADSNNQDNIEDDDELNDLKTVKDELETQGQLKELHDATTHNMLNENYNRIDEISREVENVKKSVSDSSRFNLQEFSKKPKVDSSSVAELNAKIDALSSLMKQILEVNRKILTEMEMKK